MVWILGHSVTRSPHHLLFHSAPHRARHGGRGAHSPGMDHHALRELMSDQDGVISRRQADKLGVTPADIRRLIRHRQWARVHPGVYVNHTGERTWQQRAWAAVLFAAPAALCGGSALRAANGPGHRDHDDEGVIHVAVDHTRTVVTPVGVRAHRLVGLNSRAQWNRCPPRLRIEEAVLDVAAAATDDFSSIAVLADAVQSRRTTADRLDEAFEPVAGSRAATSWPECSATSQTAPARRSSMPT